MADTDSAHNSLLFFFQSFDRNESFFKILSDFMKFVVEFSIPASITIGTLQPDDMQVSGTNNNTACKCNNTKELSQAYPHVKLKTSNDLQFMRLLAQDRNKLKTLPRTITEFAEAIDSDEPEASSG
ncbi:hypothetical protein ElyMa_006012100 [Elysia marginata]|uniref:Uncharacterized protein n=1 Tax=Elysia marginata TaxID=1093978 RepID=A0AAV4GHC7_9GAST|nr:hypothetical protein ElyMa_006012100 [Elysia marginata]